MQRRRRFGYMAGHICTIGRFFYQTDSKEAASALPRWPSASVLDRCAEESSVPARMSRQTKECYDCAVIPGQSWTPGHLSPVHNAEFVGLSLACEYQGITAYYASGTYYTEQWYVSQGPGHPVLLV